MGNESSDAKSLVAAHTVVQNARRTRCAQTPGVGLPGMVVAFVQDRITERQAARINKLTRNRDEADYTLILIEDVSAHLRYVEIRNY